MANQTVSSVARTGSTATWRRKRGEMLVGQQRLARQLVAADQLELVVAGHRLGPVAAGDQARGW